MMKKALPYSLLAASFLAFFPWQSVDACSAFIIGKNLTSDGSVLYGRTEDYPFPPLPGAHNKNYLVQEAKDYKEGEEIKDKSNGFTYPHLAHEYKYTYVPDASRDTDEGVYGAHGQNEFGVTMSGTVSTYPNEKILEVDPLVKNGLNEASLINTILPRVKTAREGVELVAKILDEKGSAEGNTIIIADKNELWYMEILSGHQYVAIKYPDDSYSIFPNMYFLGHVDFSDKENVIASSAVEETAKKAKHYKEVDGKFHIANSYNTDDMLEGNRSRAYAGLKLMDPDSKVKYDDAYFDFFQKPTDSQRKYSVADAIEIQRNRFESLADGFKPDDTYGKRGENGRPDIADKDKAVYKYAPGNENVIDAHIYQIKSDLPAPMASIMWLSQAPSRNTPYIPFYGNVTDTYQAFKPQDFTYNPDSFYWVAWHIDQMAVNHPDIFGSSVKEIWQNLEKDEVAEQEARDAKYSGKSDQEAQDLSSEVTQDALDRSGKVFKNMKDLEADMEDQIKKHGAKDESIEKLSEAMKKSVDNEEKTEAGSQGLAAKEKAQASLPSWSLMLGGALLAVLTTYLFRKFRKK